MVSIGDVPYLADAINKNGFKGSPLPACPAPVATRTWTTKSQRASSCPAPAGKKHLLDEDAEDIVVVDDANGEKVVTLREQPQGHSASEGPRRLSETSERGSYSGFLNQRGEIPRPHDGPQQV